MLRIRRCLVLSLIVLLVAATLHPRAARAAGTSEERAVKVMTYNVNEGTDFVEVLGAQTFPDFLAAVQLTINNVRATNPPCACRRSRTKSPSNNLSW